MKSNKLILAVVGMAGSGKTEVIKYLEKNLSAPKVYFGKPMFDRMKRDGLEINYANERIIREKMRKEQGMGVMATLSKPKIDKLLKTDDIILIESLYSWEEYKIMKESYGKSFRALAVQASPETRYTRLLNRKNERPMTSHEEFETRDFTELENLQKGAPIARADFTVINEDSLEYLHKQLDIIINKIN